MKLIYNNIIPTKDFAAINLFGILFVRKGIIITKTILNHEAIHSAQMKELFYLLFYVWYLFEWIYKLVLYGKEAYFQISFEREAYENDRNSDYLIHRKPYSFVYYLKKKTGN
ncbi:MAG: hypothetical protein LUG18_14625 [Candidatus Azobacteroides sp.]|nr:hypothetical protein [Candidatus Azobacteroides sp.]